MNAFLKSVYVRFFVFVTLIFLGVTQEKVLAHGGGHHADHDAVLVEVFERDDCQHCQDLRQFLMAYELKSDNPHIDVVTYNVRTDAGRSAFDRLTKKENLSQATPIILVGTQVIQGFDTPETTGVMLDRLIHSQVGQSRLGLEQYLSTEGGSVEHVREGTCDLEEGCVLQDESLLVAVPFVGVIDVAQFSLPTLAVVLGLIDGFNPCAMWVLVTFLLVLIQMRSRERLLAVAGLFIVAETVMYYLILNVWFTTWDFVGLDQWVTPLVGFLALGGGIFFLYEWYTSDGTCKVVNLEERAKISGRIKKLATEPFTWLTAGGVVLLAFSVNIIEFACSIGIPQAFTKILEMNDLSFLGTQSLMLIYILGYMVDDFLVFGLALWGAEKLHMTTQYAKWSNLIGGILMILLGTMLIFAPNWLRML